jgi:hypothetical protein
MRKSTKEPYWRHLRNTRGKLLRVSSILKLRFVEHPTVSFGVDSILQRASTQQMMIKAPKLPVFKDLLRNLFPRMALTRCGKLNGKS